MKEITIDILRSKAENKFILANAVIQRAKQIADGSLPYVDNFDPTNPIITALKEIAADRVQIRKGKKKDKETAVKVEEKPREKRSLAKETRKKKKK